MLMLQQKSSQLSGVMPRLGLGIHEFGTAGSVFTDGNSWTPRPSLGVTIEYKMKIEILPKSTSH